MNTLVDRSVSPAGLDLQERVVEINRVAKVVKGGRRFSFTALVVVGDENGIVGVGYGKANEVPLAIQKGVERAKKNLFRVPRHGSTITHQNLGVFGAGRVLLKPASPGTGVIAGGGVRAVLELAGIHDILSKSLGTQNPINLVKATVAGLQGLRTPEEVAELRGLSINAVLGLAPKEEVQANETITVGGDEELAEAEAVAEAPEAEAPAAPVTAGATPEQAAADAEAAADAAANEPPVEQQAHLESPTDDGGVEPTESAAEAAAEAPADEAAAAEAQAEVAQAEGETPAEESPEASA